MSSLPFVSSSSLLLYIWKYRGKKQTLYLPNAVVLIPERTLEAKADDDEVEVEVEGDDDDDADAEVVVLASASSQCSLSTFWSLREGLLLLL